MPAGLDVHIVMDNYGTHKTAIIRNWFAKRPRFHVHFTPTYGSWLNLVERWFAEITNKRIRRGIFRSVKELESAIREYIDVHNEDPKPFVWTRTADEILASIARFAQRTATLAGISLIYVTNQCDRRLGAAVVTPWASTSNGLTPGDWLIWDNIAPVAGSITISDVADPGALGIINAVRISSSVPEPMTFGVVGLSIAFIGLASVRRALSRSK